MVQGLTIKPGLALGSWAAFSGSDAEWVVYDVLYAYCREMIKGGTVMREAEGALQRGIMRLWK